MPRYNNPRKTWRYSNEFKAKAVQLSLMEGVQVQDVAKTLDIHPLHVVTLAQGVCCGLMLLDTPIGDNCAG